MPAASARRAPAAPALPPALRRSLRKTFGIEALRDGQHEVIERVLAGHDTLAIMPTGAGKSLCYQLPALHLDGLTLVVSPLIALMKDQTDALQQAGVDAVQLNSALPGSEQGQSLGRIAAGDSRLVFTTPERLTDPELLALLKAKRVALFVVDEAHCISQWGHDFRPAFLELGGALRELGDPPVLALTATAPDSVVDDIRGQLGRPQMHVVDTGMFRPNLRLQCVQCVRDGEKLQRTLEALHRASGAGIIYTATVKVCDELHDQLLEAGVSVSRYHGKLPRAERVANQEAFMRGEARVMVATNAFGMGIDRADLRFVLHYQLPGSPEAYYQEAGRAGRDGETADCALLFDRRDRQVQQFFLARRYPEADDLQQVHGALVAAGGPLGLDALKDRLKGLGGNRVAVALSVLRDAGLARGDRSKAWKALQSDAGPAQFDALAVAYAERAERDHAALERMVFYAQTGFCRWRVLLEHFGEPLPFEGERCGVCDNCLRPPAEPAADEPASTVAPAATAAWHVGDAVQVPRYGSGRVEQASADEVSVRFTDGALRQFVASYVQPAAGGGSQTVSAGAADGKPAG